jgi:hypothetical protein
MQPQSQPQPPSPLEGYIPISLGYNCYIKRYLDTIRSSETNLFDWLGTSMWGILSLFQADFKDAFDRSHYSLVKVTTTRRPIVTHNQYYIRVLHDDMNTYTEKYLRRLERLKRLLDDDQTGHILFIRLEESQSARISYDHYKHHYQHDELHYMRLLVEYLVTNYPKLQFSFVYIKPSTGAVPEATAFEHLGHRVVQISTGSELSWDKCTTQLAELFELFACAKDLF